MLTIPVLSPDQLRAWDAAAEAAGTPLAVLMERAGHAVADAVSDRFEALARRGVLVACGNGNNGGDGWVAARVLHSRGFPVCVVESGSPRAGIALDARRDALASDVVHMAATAEWPATAVIVDALLGAGASGPLRGGVTAMIGRLRAHDVPVIAVDAPSGVDLATGADAGALSAAVSVTFGGPRRGHLMARDVVGDLVVADIGMPEIGADVPRLVTAGWAASVLPGLASRSHKGTRGRVVIVGGVPAMVGAARLAARGAFGAGAGLVHAAVPPASLEVLRLAEPDVQVIDAGPWNAGGALADLVGRADAVVVGPGLGRDQDHAVFVLDIITQSRSVVVDADALVALSRRAGAVEALGTGRDIILTPHIGEFRLMFPSCPVNPEVDPWGAASHGAETTGCTVLLKGVPTVIAMRGQAARTVAAGNPGLATGGSGDVLSGIIAALLAQGVPPFDAAAAGAQALGDAADHAARRHTARAMRPMDVVHALPDVWRAWDRRRGRESALPFILPRARTT